MLPVHLLDDGRSFFQASGQFILVGSFVRCFSVRCELCNREGNGSQLSCSARTAAWARATRTVRSAFPILSFPSKLRTMYFASWPRHDASNFVMMATFLFCDYTSEVRYI